MGAADRNTIVEVFQDRSKAEHAVAELLRSRFVPEQIGYVVASALMLSCSSPATPRSWRVRKPVQPRESPWEV